MVLLILVLEILLLDHLPTAHAFLNAPEFPVERMPRVGFLLNFGEHPGFCGATLIGDHTVVTAAHCLEGHLDYPDFVEFYLPATRQKKTELLAKKSQENDREGSSIADEGYRPEGVFGVKIRLKSIQIHPEYLARKAWKQKMSDRYTVFGLSLDFDIVAMVNPYDIAVATLERAVNLEEVRERIGVQSVPVFGLQSEPLHSGQEVVQVSLEHRLRGKKEWQALAEEAKKYNADLKLQKQQAALVPAAADAETVDYTPRSVPRLESSDTESVRVRYAVVKGVNGLGKVFARKSAKDGTFFVTESKDQASLICGADSGSPAFVVDANGNWKLAGVVSYAMESVLANRNSICNGGRKVHMQSIHSVLPWLDQVLPSMESLVFENRILQGL